MLNDLMRGSDKVSLVKQDGTRIDDIEANVGKNIYIADISLPIEEGDSLIRALPNGLEEVYIVVDRGYTSVPREMLSAGDLREYYYVKVRKQTAMSERRPSGTTIYNLNGENARVNIQSHDASVNVVNASSSKVFNDLKQAITAANLDPELHTDIISHVENMERTQGTHTFIDHYQGFINSLAAHATVFAAVAPYVPALTQLIAK